MVWSMRHLLKRLRRPLAGAFVLAFAVVSSAECATAAMTPEQKACCAAMNGDCEMGISSSCCSTEVLDSQSFAATKPTTASVPVAALVAVLITPAVATTTPQRFVSQPDASSMGPPGIPTYLFVSSFRI